MDKEQPLISVIVPVYNVEKYLKKCVDSITSQTYKNLEILLVDDGSTDSSGQICNEFEKNDARIKVIHKKNGGLSDARNAGLDRAKGQYYAFIDSDDYIQDNTIEIMLNAIKKNKSEIAVCNMIRFLEEGETVQFYCPTDHEVLYQGNQRYKTLNQPSVCNKLFEAKLFEGIRFPKGKYYEDTFVYHEVLYRANSIVLTGTDSYWYLSREDSILGQPQYTERYFDFIEAVYKRADFLLKHDVQPYAKEACLSLYAAIANAESNIEENTKTIEKFSIARKQYTLVYNELMKTKNQIGIKQKLRLMLLKYFPKLHVKIYR
ncbi:glycosyltransferase family 2 protein [Anaerostipes sp. Marseille-Q3525]|uniref:glycosyltransferase family 2 protein n=1 Tax=Anaerostipes sp. Marseille-Q3525 TaxID=2758418 RepID=UPI001BAC3C6D|nr:glycosyltransferase family 2 protein [Anaerostipes sp. Marseille-Q3525]MBR9961668.1 glycosyltransferase family 2 protein [Anaerostipes sp. Marseille-Q3525]